MHTRCEVSMSTCMGSRVNQIKISKWLLFKNYKSEWLKCNQYLVAADIHIHTNNKVSMILYVGKRAN